MLSNTIGSSIKKLRKDHNMNQDELAHRLNIRRQTLSAYERGVSIPNIFVLIRIADIFSVSLDELTGRELPKER